MIQNINKEERAKNITVKHQDPNQVGIKMHTIDTPFLTDLKTQTALIERSVILHIALVQKFQSPGCTPCLRTSGLFRALPRFANQALFSLFSLPEGRERSPRPSLGGRRRRFMVIGHFFRLEPGFWFFGADGRVPRFGTT